MKTLMAVALIFSLLAQPMAFAASSGDVALLELDTLIAEIESDSTDSSHSERREERARKKIERRFDRQFEKFSKRMQDLVALYSEEELRRSLEEYTVRNENLIDQLVPNGKGRDPIEGILQHSPTGELKTALLALTTEERKTELHGLLEREIERAGSARAYLKQTRATLRSMNGCLIKAVALFGLVVPAGGALMLGAVGLGFVLTFGGSIAAIGSWGTVGVMAATFSGGGASIMASLDHLGSFRGNCRLEKRR